MCLDINSIKHCIPEVCQCLWKLSFKVQSGVHSHVKHNQNCYSHLLKIEKNEFQSAIHLKIIRAIALKVFQIDLGDKFQNMVEIID